MLRFTASTSAKAAAAYYEQALSHSDYYDTGSERGVWGGKLAEKLQLSGEVDRDQFQQLAEGRDPHSGDKLTARIKHNRRAGTDATFSAPKSWSVVAALSAPEHQQELVRVFEESVQVALTEMETDMRVRVRKAGKSEDRISGNMAYAKFLHTTTRPVDHDGVLIPDPHYHQHVYMFNLSDDLVEGKIKALQLGQCWRDVGYYEAVFETELMRRTAELGYGVETAGKAFNAEQSDYRSWKIAGISEDAIREFSQRTKEVEAAQRTMAEKLKDKSKKLVDKILSETGAKTRNHKMAVTLSESEILASWWQRLPDGDKDNWDNLRGNDPDGPSSPTPPIAPIHSIQYALDHHLERKSVISEKQLLTTALKHSESQYTVDELRQALSESEVIQQVDKHQVLQVTTPNVLAEEKQLIAHIKAERKGYETFGNSKTHRVRREYLSEEQRLAVKGLLDSRAGVVALLGSAGVGKTTLMQEFKDAIEQPDDLSAKPMTLHAFIPTNEGRDMLRDEGFSNAHTLHQLLHNRDVQQQIQNGVVWVDESSQISLAQMHQLTAVAKAQNARVLLSGDQYQHNSVERGDAFRLAGKYAGLPLYKVGTIIRQRENPRYQKAVQHLAKGDTIRGVHALNKMGAIREIANDDTRYRQLAETYAHSIQNGIDTLVVSPTHAESKRVTSAIRTVLKEQGQIQGDELERIVLRDLNWTLAQKQQMKHYQQGMVLKPVKPIAGMKMGESAVIIAQQDAQTLIVQHTGGTKSAVPLDQANRFNLYRQDSIQIAQGDQIRLTQNIHDTQGYRLNNGSYHTIGTIHHDGSITTDSGHRLKPDEQHLTHGFVSTSYASQGKTVDQVLISQSSESFGMASSREQFYVSASRGRKDIQLFTDDQQRLMQEVAKIGERTFAIELTNREQGFWKRHAQQMMQRARESYAQMEEAARQIRQRGQTFVRATQTQYAYSGMGSLNGK